MVVFHYQTIVSDHCALCYKRKAAKEVPLFNANDLSLLDVMKCWHDLALQALRQVARRPQLADR
jgi:hypothetical protein